jgi:hypothetical protein
LWTLLQTNLVADEHRSLLDGLQSIKNGYFGNSSRLPIRCEKRRRRAKPIRCRCRNGSTPQPRFSPPYLDVMEGANQASEARTAAFRKRRGVEPCREYRIAAAGALLLMAQGAMTFAVFTIARADGGR